MIIDIYQTRGHCEVAVDGDFFCSADTYTEAVEESKDIDIRGKNISFYEERKTEQTGI